MRLGARRWREELKFRPKPGGPWQVDFCQFFTRDKVAELCLRQVTFPKNLLTVRLLEPAAGQGAFFLPLLPRLVQAGTMRRDAKKTQGESSAGAKHRAGMDQEFRFPRGASKEALLTSWATLPTFDGMPFR